jgi:hypothetical protein
MRRLLIAPLLLLIVACSEPAAPVIDGSNEGNYVTTLREVRDSLSAPDRLRFEAALKVIQADVFAKAKSRQDYAEAMRRELDGKTGDQVIAIGADRTKGLSGKAVDAVFDAKNMIGDEARKIADAAKGQ